MPLYDVRCAHCQWQGEIQAHMDDDDAMYCPACDTPNLEKIHLRAPLGRMKGVIPKGGGPDKFTADMLGVPLKDLPPGLRTTTKPR